ncbi:uncharacterized protein LOC119735921 isoform X2 [Patiria miniata]|uniref:Uncharacterized protein n=1 Tax=Patiria miniata TaxID=46514 RepID=A0A914AP50_PATMI|nr:uncharacterized protein LOC119735921 isoform X2 [Patiria miniata]
MRQVPAVLMGFATLLTVAFAAPPIEVSAPPPPITVPVVTKYITSEVQTLAQDASITLIGHLCEQSKGLGVQVTVLLNNNPDWDTSFGVLWYYVVDDPKKNSTAALCSNYPAGVPGANCTVKAWPSVSDIYIKGHAGQSEAVSFTIDVEVRPAARRAPVRKLDFPPSANELTVYLSEIVTLATSQSLAYHQKAQLTFTFCPTPQTGTRYEVQAVVTAIDGRSSYALYICDKLPCVVDGPNVIAHNGRQLPSNTVTTASGTWKTLYALVVCWGGVWNPTQHEYIGKFVFNAHMI